MRVEGVEGCASSVLEGVGLGDRDLLLDKSKKSGSGPDGEGKAFGEEEGELSGEITGEVIK